MAPVRHDWTRDEVRALFELPLPELIFRAQAVHRLHFDPCEVQISTLLSIKTGGCPEDCAYCPQSVRFDTGVEAEALLQVAAVRAAAERAKAAGATRFCMKPVASGAERTADGLRNTDALALADSGNVAADYAQINPYCFEPPISPHIAAKEAGIEVDTSKIRRGYDALAAQADWVVVEGAGGWFAPISDHRTMITLAYTFYDESSRVSRR